MVTQLWKRLDKLNGMEVTIEVRNGNNSLRDPSTGVLILGQSSQQELDRSCRERAGDLTRRRVSLTAIRSQTLSEPETVGARRWRRREETGGRGVVMCT